MGFLKKNLTSSRVHQSHLVAEQPFINKKRVFAWSASTLALVIVPAVALAWSASANGGATRLETSSSKPIIKVNGQSTGDDSLNPKTSESGSATDTDGSSSSTGTTQNSNSTNITVNDQAIPIPSNGSVDQTITSDGQTTHISAQNHTSSTGSHNNTSTNVNIHSSSSSNSTDSETE